MAGQFPRHFFGKYMARAYYKTDDSAVLAALKTHNDECQVIRYAGKRFAKHFGGNLLVNNSIHGYRIAGLVFDPLKDGRFWTFEDQKAGGEQHPRMNIIKATPEEKVALATLNADWKAFFPTQKSDFSPVMAAMGTDWENCAFNGGFAMFEHGGFVYATASVKLADCMVEILGSEYKAARERFDADRTAARAAADR